RPPRAIGRDMSSSLRKRGGLVDAPGRWLVGTKSEYPLRASYLLQTGWQSLGTFGRTFRDVTGESPGELRAREQAAPHELERVPACFLSAAYRPDLTIAVSEKRRHDAGGINGSEETEVP